MNKDWYIWSTFFGKITLGLNPGTPAPEGALKLTAETVPKQCGVCKTEHGALIFSQHGYLCLDCSDRLMQEVREFLSLDPEEDPK